RAAAVENLPISIVVTGPIEAQSLSPEAARSIAEEEVRAQTFRLRPAAGGVSLSVANNSAGSGTFGCLAYGRTPPRDGRTLVLSCNHVLADSGSAAINACIHQPGVDDGGTCANDQVAILERYVPINFAGTVNYVDCATGWCWPDRVRRELAWST